MTKIFERLSELSLLLLFLVMLAEVLFRYIPSFSSAQPWIPGVIAMLDIWLIFLGSVIAMQSNTHLRIKFFEKFMTPKVKELNRIIVNLITLCLLVLMIVSSIPIVRTGMDLNFGGVPFSKGYSFVALPVCISFMIPIIISRIIRSVKVLRVERGNKS